MQLLNTPPKPFAWSFSAVDNFYTCPRKYYNQVVAKTVSDQSTFRNDGQVIHDILRHRLMTAREMPSHLKHWDRWIDELLDDGNREPVSLQAEQKLAFTEDFEPCLYFDKDKKVWCRTVVDVLKIRGDRAKVWDWKTGRIKPEIDQLMICSTAVFAHYPSVKEIEAALIFLKEDTGPHIPRNNCTHEIRVTRADLKPFWGRYIHKVDALERAVQMNDWPATPNGLCRNYCPVHSCPHNGHYGG